MKRTAVINVWETGNGTPIKSVHCDMRDLYKEKEELEKEYPEPEYEIDWVDSTCR